MKSRPTAKPVLNSSTQLGIPCVMCYPETSQGHLKCDDNKFSHVMSTSGRSSVVTSPEIFAKVLTFNSSLLGARAPVWSALTAFIKLGLKHCLSELRCLCGLRLICLLLLKMTKTRNQQVRNRSLQRIQTSESCLVDQ